MVAWKHALSSRWKREKESLHASLRISIAASLISRWARCQILANQRAPEVNIDVNSKPRIVYFQKLMTLKRLPLVQYFFVV